jgi:uncharacterized membrane protein
LGTGRLEAFSDGVFAIVITLLILEIKVPVLVGDNIHLGRALLELWPKYASYIMSFIVVGVYWVAHHNKFHFIKQTDRVLLWINIFFLMSVAVIPFPAALIGEYLFNSTAILVYGGVQVITGALNTLMWWYATHNHRLVDISMSEEMIPITYIIPTKIDRFWRPGHNKEVL